MEVLTKKISEALLALPVPVFGFPVKMPSFIIGEIPVTASGPQLNYLNAATGTTGNTSKKLVFSEDPTFTGVVTIPTPFILGGVSVTTTGTQLNYLNVITGRTGTGNVVCSASPTLSGTLTVNGTINATGDIVAYA